MNPINWRQPWLKGTTSEPILALVPALPIVAMLFYDIMSQQGDLTTFVALRLQCAGRLLAGEQAYIDFWDWSQPVVLAFATWPMLLQQWLDQIHVFVRLELITKIMIWFVVAFSFFLCQTLLYQAGKQTSQSAAITLVIGQARQLQLPVALGLALANYLVRFQFGDVQHLFVLTFIPFLILRWLRYSGVNIPTGLALAVGFAAGLGLSLDVTYWPVLIITEAIWLVQVGKMPKLHSELYALLAAIFLSFWHILAMTSAQKVAFFKWIMPLRLGALLVFDRALLPYGNAPQRCDLVYLISSAIILNAPLSKRLSLSRALIALTLWGLVLFIVEGQGLSFQSVVGNFSGCLLLVIGVFNLVSPWQKHLVKHKLIYCAAITLLSPLAAGQLMHSSRTAFELAYGLPALEKKADALPDLFQTIEQRTNWKDQVMLLSYKANAIYPIVTNLERKQSGYLLWTEPLYLLTMLEDKGLLSEDLKNFRTCMVQKLTTDINSGEAKLIFVDQMREEETLEKYKLNTVLSTRYEQTDSCKYYSACQEPRENIGLRLPFLIYELKTSAVPAQIQDQRKNQKQDQKQDPRIEQRKAP